MILKNKKMLMIAKYIFCMIAPLGAVLLHNMSWKFLVMAVVEVLIIAALTNLLVERNKVAAYIMNVILLMIVNVQFAILFWGNSFISMVMINNLGSVEALSGKGLEYGITLILAVIFTLLPISYIKTGKRNWLILILLLGVYFVTYVCGMGEYSPYHAVYDLVRQHRLQKQAEEIALSSDDNDQDFKKSSVTNYFNKPQELETKPNVILIFTEGLSQNIVEDENDIMPNLQAFQKESVFFENYFNHTFATYMGLSGQLYSGYQKEIYDSNCLVSLQKVFGDYGYQSTFINTEPKNQEFTEYLETFSFDYLINDTTRLDGINDSISDKSAYDLLFETAIEQNEEEKPFLISMYTFGTHVSFDSVHEKYEDGSDPVLNRFYNLDVQFGAFFEKFKNSPLADNTVLIFTTDHATYQDSDFISTYPDYYRACTMMDRTPFMIYHKGIEPKVIDAAGRNSLDLAPTILDYLDMTSENYFLGESLFSPVDNNSMFDTYFESMGAYFESTDGVVRSLSFEDLLQIQVQIERYFALKMSDILTEIEDDSVHLYAGYSQGSSKIEIKITGAKDWDQLQCAVWSDENGQDDFKWHKIEYEQNDSSVASIDISDYKDNGSYEVHLYAVDGEEMVFLAATSLTIER